MDDDDEAVAPHPREEIARLELRIEQLAARLENCQKFVLAARVALAFGGVALLAGLFGLMRLDAVGLLLAIATALGGIVVLGSNSSTARETAAELATMEARRADLIARIDLRVVESPGTLP